MWNDDGMLSVRARKIVIYLISFLVTLCLFFITFCYVIPKGNGDIELYISVTAVILTIVGFILSITNNLISQQLHTKLNMTLDIRTIMNHAIITCGIENKGQQRLDPVAFYIFLDQPVLNAEKGIYKVNHILKHDCMHNCKLSELCRTKEINNYPYEFIDPKYKDKYYAVKKLDFLAPDSMLYVNPGECFTEDVTIKLGEGVYRVLFIGVFGKSECLCANRQFIIE